jgi:hypothetical protein
MIYLTERAVVTTNGLAIYAGPDIVASSKEKAERVRQVLERSDGPLRIVGTLVGCLESPDDNPSLSS